MAEERYTVVNPQDLSLHPEFDRLFEPADPEDLAGIRRSLEKGERFAPLLVNPRGQVLAGVEEWQAARDLGWTEVSAVLAPRLGPAQERSLMVAENIRRREIREEHLWRGMNNFFDMEPLRPPGGW